MVPGECQNRRSRRPTNPLALVLLGIASAILAGCSNGATVPSGADLQRVPPPAHDVSKAMNGRGQTGDWQVDVAGGDDEETSWDGDSSACDEALARTSGSQDRVTFGDWPGDNEDTASRLYTNDNYGQVVVVATADTDRLAELQAVLDECKEVGVAGRPGSTIRSATFEPVNPVGVDGAAIAFDLRLGYTDAQNVFRWQAWEGGGGILMIVQVFPGLGANGEPLDLSEQQMSAVVRAVDRRV